jgi:chromosome segregation ATPase
MRLFRSYRELEEKLRVNEAQKYSLLSHIDFLDERDETRRERIAELEERLLKAVATIKDMRERLTGLCPNRKEEP